MEHHLRVRLLSWRLGRAIRTPLGALVGIALAVLLAAGVVQRHAAVSSTILRSPCMPYTLRVPLAWQAHRVPMADCGNPVLFDEYHLFIGGQQLALTVQAVSLASNRAQGLLVLPRSYGTVVEHATSGQTYTVLLEKRNGLLAADAAFTRANLSYFMTVESTENADPRAVLVRAMDGWTANATGP